MRVYVYPANLYGCGYYRLIWPAKTLQALGHDVIIVPPGERNDITGVIDKETDVPLDVRYPEDADVVCVQRPTHKYLKDIIPLMRAKGTAVIVDMDDDLSCIHPEVCCAAHQRKKLESQGHGLALLGAPRTQRQDPRASRLAHPGTAPITGSGLQPVPNGLIPKRLPSGSAPRADNPPWPPLSPDLKMWRLEPRNRPNISPFFTTDSRD